MGREREFGRGKERGKERHEKMRKVFSGFRTGTTPRFRTLRAEKGRGKKGKKKIKITDISVDQFQRRYKNYSTETI